MGWYEMEHTLKWLFQDLKKEERELLLKPKEFERNMEALEAKYRKAYRKKKNQ